MSQPTDIPPHLHDLIDLACNGLLADDQVAELEQALREHPQARRFYLDYCQLHTAIQFAMAADRSIEPVIAQITAGEPQPSSMPATLSSAGWGRKVVSRPLRTSLVVASLTVAAALLWLAVLPHSWPETTPDGRISTGKSSWVVAQLTGSEACQWEESEGPVLQRMYLTAGRRLRLLEGLAEVTFKQGTRVVLHAPVEFELVSENAGYLYQGTLAAQVPVQAAGFTVKSPSAEVVDLGTEFGVQVDASGATEVHVFAGRVQVAATDAALSAEKQVLLAGQALRVELGTVRRLAADPESFAGRPNSFVRGIKQESPEKRAAERSKYFAELRQDPALVALYSFQRQPQQPKQLENLATGPLAGSNGQIVGGTWAAGRGGEHTGLSFDGEDDLVQVQLPDQPLNALTMAAWVRLDYLFHSHNSLLHTDAWDEEGRIHWTVLPDGRLEFAVCSNSPAVVQSNGSMVERLRHWTHLAVVYDPAARATRIYLDGQLDSIHPYTEAHPPLLGSAQIGNWQRMPRGLTGWMDELVVLGRALKDEEIETLHRVGLP